MMKIIPKDLHKVVSGYSLLLLYIWTSTLYVNHDVKFISGFYFSFLKKKSFSFQHEQSVMFKKSDKTGFEYVLCFEVMTIYTI